MTGPPPSGGNVDGWDEAIARLRARTGVAAALAAAGLLLVARPIWAGRVAVHTSGHDVLFTQPGASYPFEKEVRVSLTGRRFEVRLLGAAGVVDATSATAADVDAVLAAYLLRLEAGG